MAFQDPGHSRNGAFQKRGIPEMGPQKNKKKNEKKKKKEKEKEKEKEKKKKKVRFLKQK
jgi:hypothetical protein